MVSCVGSWELEFRRETAADVFVGLMVRDLLHGASYDLRPSGGDDVYAFDIEAADEFEDDMYRLAVDISIEGPDEPEVAQRIAMQLFDEVVEEAQELVAEAVMLGEEAAKDVVFVAVNEDVERWDLVVPDWLAPDGVVVPFGFRPTNRETGEQWPDDRLLDSYGRVVLVPDGKRLLLYGVPSPKADRNELPVS